MKGIIGEPVIDTDTPITKLGKVLRTVEANLDLFGLDITVIKKAKLLCPDLIEKTYCHQDKIDTDFIKQGDDLLCSDKWLEFVAINIVPYFWAWCDVILAIKGKIVVRGVA